MTRLDIDHFEHKSKHARPKTQDLKLPDSFPDQSIIFPDDLELEPEVGEDHLAPQLVPGLETGPMSCCSCSKTRETCPSVEQEPFLEKIQPRSDPSFQQCPPEVDLVVIVIFINSKALLKLCFQTPYPCFCFDTSGENLSAAKQGPGLDVVFTQSADGSHLVLHLVRIDKPSIGEHSTTKHIPWLMIC